MVEYDDDTNVIESTWAFKIKIFTDGLIKKFKAQFCAHDDQKLERMDLFERYAPVMQWNNIWIMLRL